MRLVSLLLILRTATARPVLLGLGRYQLQLQIPLLGEKINGEANNNDNAVEMISAPSIGLHFTNSYAMASAHFVNGTTTDLFKMGADVEYNRLLSHWMDMYAQEAGTHAQSPSSAPPPPPTSKSSESNTDLENTITILTPFLSKLHSAITHFEETHGPITHLTPAIFPLTTVHEAIFRTALIRAGLVAPKSDAEAEAEAVLLLRDSDSAYAGLERAAPCFKPTPEYEDNDDDHHEEGAFRCTTRRGGRPCGNAQRKQQQHQQQQQQQHILFLSFDNHSFSAAMTTRHAESLSSSSPSSQRHPHTQQTRLLGYTASSQLGWYNLPVWDTPRAAFWRRMQDAIVRVVGAGGKPPGRIVVLGERGADHEFRKVVEEAVWRAWEVDVEMLVEGEEGDGGLDGEWAVARGAAAVGWKDV